MKGAVEGNRVSGVMRAQHAESTLRAIANTHIFSSENGIKNDAPRPGQAPHPKPHTLSMFRLSINVFRLSIVHFVGQVYSYLLV